jgi:hypothetical protein
MLIPGKRIAYDAAFDDSYLPGTMKTRTPLASSGVLTAMRAKGLGG